MANPLLSLFKNYIFKDTPVHRALGGGALGYGLSQYEQASGAYQDPTIGHIVDIGTTGTGTLIGAVSKKKPYLAASLAAFLMGTKQVGFQQTQSLTDMANTVAGYTKIQEDLAEKTKEISQNQLATAVKQHDTAEMANTTSRKWLDMAKYGIPAAGLLAALATGIYAYNSLKKDKGGAPRGKGSVSLEIPEEKLSPQFYSRLGREILFKDKDENGRKIKRLYIKDNGSDDVDKLLAEMETEGALPKLASSKFPTNVDNRYEFHIRNLARAPMDDSSKAGLLALFDQNLRARDSMGNSVNRFISKYAPTLLEHFGLITPEKNIKAYVNNISVPNLSTSRYNPSDPNRVAEIINRFSSEINAQTNPYFTGSFRSLR